MATLSSIITPTNVLTASSTSTLSNKTISGASNTLTNIPLTTAVTGTLATTNGGTGLTSFTANGVVYASSTSALTTGSALTFNGTDLKVTGGNGGQLTLDNGGQQFTQLLLQRNGSLNTGGDFLVDGTGNTFGFRSLAANMPFVWSLSATAGNAVEQMRLTSTGLAVGTSSVISGSSGRGNVTVNGSSDAFLVLGTGGARRGGLYTQGTQVTLVNDTATLTLETSGATRATFDASGNLGLGVTPSAWATLTGFDVASGGAGFAGNAGGAYVTENAYFDGSWKYKVSSTASARYQQVLGVHSWFTAPSGTAGNAISFTQAMTLDASGNLGVGITSPAVKLHVGGSGSQYIRLETTSGAACDWITTSSDTYFGPRTNTALAFQTNNTERARITSGGNLLVGTTVDSGARFESSNTGDNVNFFTRVGGSRVVLYNASGDSSFGTTTNTPLRFVTNDTERARITSGGDFLVGTTTAIAGSSPQMVLKTGTNTTPCYYAWNSATSGNNTFHEFGTEGTYTARGSITYNRGGGVVAYNTTSDYRSKDIIGPVNDPGATVDALKVYMGKMKGATIERPMLIAHEAQEVTPYAVTGEKDAVNEDGTPKYQQMDHQVLVPLLIAEIQSLRARLAAAGI